MKKQVLLIAIAIFSFGVMNAQEIKFGAKAGVNFASIGGDNTDGVEGLTGFHIGGLVEILFTEKFGIQPEIVYSAQGASLEQVAANVTATQKTKLDYINVPILGKYYITNALSVEAGPQIGFLASANAETEVSNGTDVPDVDIKDVTSSTDFAIAAGASYRLPMGVFFSARYNIGISDINDTSLTNASNQNNVAQLSVGYSF